SPRRPRRPSSQARAWSAHELGGRAVDVAVDDGEAVIAGNGAQPAAARWGSSAVFDTTMAGTVVTVLSFGPSCDTESVIRPVVITTRDPAIPSCHLGASTGCYGVVN